MESDQLLFDALAGEYVALPAETEPDSPPEPVGAFLKSVRVSGFRGVGEAVVLELHPAPGLTVVAGRNGSCKSTFAEALEVALTSTSYRWRNRSAGRREPGIDGLGWAQAIEHYRPLLSYEELGNLLTAAPSALYDTLYGGRRPHGRHPVSGPATPTRDLVDLARDVLAGRTDVPAGQRTRAAAQLARLALEEIV